MSSVPEELVSVIVCTRNRGENALPTVRSVLAGTHANLEVLVLDQSDDTRTADALAPVAGADPRLVYHHLSIPGKPRTLNHARSLVRGRYVFLTDDDCEVSPDWIAAVLAEFRADPRLGCVFGRVDAAPHDAGDAYVPVCPIVEGRTIEKLGELLTMPGWGNFGMGANMVLPAAVLERLAGWDPCIGPGAKFGSGDDHDLSVRLLRAGYPIRFSPSARVVHFGVRRWSNAGKDYRRIWYGVGGVFAKHLRSGALYPGAIRVPLNQLRECARSLLSGKKPQGLSYVASWVHGFADGLRHPVDTTAQKFVSEADERGRYASRVAQIVLRGER